MLDYICEDCGFKTGNLDTYLVYRKDGEIIETPYVDNCLLYKEHLESDIKGYAHFSYCEECNKLIKIYTGYHYDDSDNFDKEKNNAEIREYMKHKRPRYTIKTFMEDMDGDNLKCPKCNNELSEVKKCLKCGSKNLFKHKVYD